MPGFIRSKDQIAAQGVDEIICITGMIPSCCMPLGGATSAHAAEITLLADGGCVRCGRAVRATHRRSDGSALADRARLSC